MAGMRRNRLSLVGPLVATMVMVAVPLANATELTHEEYVKRVEPICKTNTTANARIFKGVRSEVRADELDKASARFKRAVSAFGKTISQIKAVPQPAEDASQLTKWIGYLEIEKSFLRKIGMALEGGNKYQAQVLSVKMNRNSNQANNTILGFGFDYCRIEPSRFS